MPEEWLTCAIAGIPALSESELLEEVMTTVLDGE
jgi:hypothetical protein